MIIQKFKNGKSEIRTESAENKEDAKLNGFPEGIYSRYFIDNKPCDSYYAMIQHIIDNSKQHGSFSTPTESELKDKQKELIDKQKQMIVDQMNSLKQVHKNNPMSKTVFAEFDKIIDSIDLVGVRVRA